MPPQHRRTMCAHVCLSRGSRPRRAELDTLALMQVRIDERRCAAWALVLCVTGSSGIASSTSSGTGYPIPRDERALAALPTPRTGAWDTTEGALRLVAPARPRSVLVLDDAAPASDGFVRARLQGIGRRDVGLVMRAHVRDAPVLHVDGLAFFVRDDVVGFAPVRGTTLSEPVSSTTIPRLSTLTDLEVTLYGAGGHLVALVFDGRSKELLSTVTASVEGRSSGRVVVIAGAAHAKDVSLSVKTTALTQSERPFEPVPAEWTVELSRDVNIPRDIARLFRRVERAPHADVFITRETGAYLLRERGVTVLRAAPGVGYRHRDITFSSRVRASVDKSGAPLFVDGLKDPDLVARALSALARQHPHRAELIELGRSHQGRAILGLRIADDVTDRTRPAVLLAAGHHADEVITPEAPLDAARVLLNGARDKKIAELLQAFTIVVVPLVNPDGGHLFWHVRDDLGRTNAAVDDEAARHGLAVHGVDLNRNYPFAFGNVDDRFNSSDPRSRFYRGRAAASEPEVQAMLRLADEMRFVAAISYHAAATRILVPYTVEGARDAEPSVAWAVARELVASIPEAMPGKRYEATRNLYPVGGTDQDTLHHRHGTLAYLVELPVRAPKAGASLDEVITRSRPVWMFLLERWLRGPSLEVTVGGSAGDVEVSVDEVAWKNGERHTAHDATRMWRTYLPSMGRYTLRARTADGRERSTIVEVQRGVTRVTISLDDESDLVAVDEQ